jgi:soluble lytic murein transglycosylase-like protein
MADLSEFSPPKRWPLYAAGAAALLLLLASGSSAKPRSIREAYQKYGPVLDAAAARHGLSAALLRAVAYVESRWNPNAGSGRGAVGLLQLMPGTATSLGVTDRTDPVQNANGGAKFLASLYQKAGSWPVALAAYNWGPGNVFGSSTKMPSLYPSQWPASTQQYVREILDAEQGGVA